MAKKQLYLTYALKNNIVTHISEVESGLKCSCVCPSCGEQLIARKGSKRIHHFAHCSGQNCEYGYETSLHFAAKEIISRTKKFKVPDLYLKFSSYKKNLLISAEKEIKVDDVKLEKRYGDIVPDIVIISNGEEIFVEIFVTHSIDNNKLEKLKRAGISTIEIDLSKIDHTISTEELSNIILTDSSLKQWKYSVEEQEWLERFYNVSDSLDVVERAFTIHVDNCPIKSRVWNNKPYANFRYDCLSCEYCISVEGDVGFLCSGKQRIANLEDFNIPIEERIRDKDERLKIIKKGTKTEEKCPKCGSFLFVNENLIICGNHQGCNYKAQIDMDTGEII